jgi:hypothetical protein
MSKDMMPKRWSVGNDDGYMVEMDGGDYVEVEDVEPLVAEIERLRARVDSLRWPLAVYVHAHQTGNSVPPHIEAAARAALEVKP